MTDRRTRILEGAVALLLATGLPFSTQNIEAALYASEIEQDHAEGVAVRGVPRVGRGVLG